MALNQETLTLSGSSKDSEEGVGCMDVITL